MLMSNEQLLLACLQWTCNTDPKGSSKLIRLFIDCVLCLLPFKFFKGYNVHSVSLT